MTVAVDRTLDDLARASGAVGVRALLETRPASSAELHEYDGALARIPAELVQLSVTHATAGEER